MRWKKRSGKKRKINKAAIKNPVSGLGGRISRCNWISRACTLAGVHCRHIVHGNKRRLTTHDSKVIICILNRTSVARLRQVTHNSFRNLVHEKQLCKWQRRSSLFPSPCFCRLPSLTTGEMFFAARVVRLSSDAKAFDWFKRMRDVSKRWGRVDKLRSWPGKVEAVVSRPLCKFEFVWQNVYLTKCLL